MNVGRGQPLFQFAFRREAGKRDVHIVRPDRLAEFVRPVTADGEANRRSGTAQAPG